MLPKLSFKNSLIGSGLALLGGVLLTFAFAPFSIYPLAVISPALLLFLILDRTPKEALLRGWLYGVGLFGSGVYWVFISIHTFGDTSVFLATFITCIFIALLAFYPGFTCYLFNRYFPQDNKCKLIFAFPAVWVIIEWVRNWLFTGFPWLMLGTSQVNSPLKGYAPILSVYGISLILVVCSGLLVDGLLQLKQKNYKNVFANAAIFVMLWIGGFILTFIPWTKSVDDPIQVSLIQGNIPQNIHWSYDDLIPTLKLYEQETREHWNSKIIIWPESAIPVPLQDATDYVDFMSDEAKKYGATIITGIPIKHKSKDAYYNAVIAIGNDTGFYLKRRLVPFGEYTPFPKVFTKILDYFNIPMSQITPGLDIPKPILAHGLKIATFVCYEIAFPEQVLNADGDTDLLLTVNNDVWFGQSIALAQHLQMGQMRALELGRPLLFVSNTGITAIVKPDGKIQSEAPPDQVYVLTDTVKTVSGKTPWQRYGMDPLCILIVIFLFYAITSQRKKVS